MSIAKDCKVVSKPQLDSGEQIEVKEYTFEEFMDLILSGDWDDVELGNDIMKFKLNGTLDKEFKNKLFN